MLFQMRNQLEQDGMGKLHGHCGKHSLFSSALPCFFLFPSLLTRITKKSSKQRKREEKRRKSRRFTRGVWNRAPPTYTPAEILHIADPRLRAFVERHGATAAPAAA
jgi:hypothetical protein